MVLKIMTNEEILKIYNTEGLRGFGLEKLSESESRAGDAGATIGQITSPFGSSAGFELSDPTFQREVQQKLTSLAQLRSAGITLDFPNLARRLNVPGFTQAGGQQPVSPGAGQFNLPATAAGIIPQVTPAPTAPVAVSAAAPAPAPAPAAPAGQPAQQFVNINGAYFQQTPAGLQAVSDPNTIRGLQSGQIPSTSQAQAQAGKFATPATPATPATTAAPTDTTGTATPVPSSTADILAQAGLAPVASVTDLIKQISAQFGLDSVTKEMEALDNKAIDDVAEINNNPWLSESLRSKRVAQLQDSYEKKKNALVDRLKLQQDVVGKAITLFQNEREYRKDVLFKALDAKDKAITQERLAAAAATTDDIKEYEFAKAQGYTGSLLDFIRDKKAKDAGGGLSNVQIDNARAVASSFENSPIVKNFLEIQDRYLNAKTYTGRGDGATDIATIYDLMKVLDPTSVVREAEYATGASKSGNIFAGALARLNGLIKPEGGFVSPQAKENIFRVITDRYNTRKAVYDNFRKQKQEQADAVAPGYSLTDYSTVSTNTYEPGTVLSSGGKLWLVGSDGETVEEVGSAPQ